MRIICKKSNAVVYSVEEPSFKIAIQTLKAEVVRAHLKCGVAPPSVGIHSNLIDWLLSKGICDKIAIE